MNEKFLANEVKLALTEGFDKLVLGQQKLYTVDYQQDILLCPDTSTLVKGTVLQCKVPKCLTYRSIFFGINVVSSGDGYKGSLEGRVAGELTMRLPVLFSTGDVPAGVSTGIGFQATAAAQGAPFGPASFHFAPATHTSINPNINVMLTADIISLRFEWVKNAAIAPVATYLLVISQLPPV